MIHLNQAVIVEGKYDKIRLSTFVDAPIITTDGFGIFKNKERMKLIRKLASERGIVIVTDSDSAGFMIRNRICGSVPKEQVKNVYIPDVLGKERRKLHLSKEGKLGVEGMTTELLTKAFERAGIFSEKSEKKSDEITKSDLYEFGLTGTDNSAERRQQLQKSLDLPERMTTNTLLSVLNLLFTRDEFVKRATEIFSNGN